MTQTGRAALTLADLDAMSIEQAQALPFEERDRLLDLIIADGRHEATGYVSHRTGLYTDYFEEDLHPHAQGEAPSRSTSAAPPPPTSRATPSATTYEEQYRACFRHVETILTAARTSYARVVKMIVFLTNMDLWSEFNRIYREFIPNPPCRAVIGTTGLAQKPLAIEIVECVAYRVAD